MLGPIRCGVALMVCAVIGMPSAEAKPATQLTVSEGFTNPLGFHDPTPTFSWKLPVGVKKQTAYRITTTAGDNTWDSGWVESDQSTLVPYGGKPFTSRDKVTWQVNFRDQDGKEAGASDKATFELGLLSSDDWQAKWIRPAQDSDPNKEPVAWLRKQFDSNRKVTTARLYITARGLFQASVNGQRVGDDHFANGWTSYPNRLDTLTYDVTSMLKSGDNTLQVELAKGWYAGHLAFAGKYGIFGNHPELLAQLEITYDDGQRQVIASDASWQATWQGPIVDSSIYDGEHYDARIQVGNWGDVQVSDELGAAQLVPKPFAPVRVTETLAAKKITQPEPGHYVFDLGQNMVGWARIALPAEKDKTVTLRFAEMLNQDGTMYTTNYRSAKSTDTYTAAETGTAKWEPTFTFHGFRYVEITGVPEDAEPQLDWVSGVVLHTDLDRTGKFVSSHAKLNQLHSNAIWGQRGNFLDIPTDCPQRDERLGWTGDAQVFCPTAMFHYDCHAFWKSWLGSMRDDQFDDGRIPHVIPDCLFDGNSPGWMDAATVVPWEVYIRTGDTEVLAENLDMMEKLIAHYRSRATDGLITEIPAFGDWLQPYAKETRGDTPAALIGTAYYARSAQLLSDSARVLGKDDLADKYAQEAAGVRKAFAAHYFNNEGKLQNAPETQTAYVLALAYDLIPADIRPQATDNLVRLVHEADNHLRTGFLGTAHLVQVLDKTGHQNLAYELLLKETYPSWFYSINQGATTVWERWNSYSHKDGFGDAGMNSFNHYAYGAIGQWMYERVAGLAPDAEHPGYKHMIVEPLIVGPLDSAKATLETPYGLASSGWEKQDGKATITIVVPPNTSATFLPPTNQASDVVSITARTVQDRIEVTEGDRLTMELPPGTHKFEVKLPE
ncbi:alpha-L-rhamnosidase [Aeoliella mucimassa]|uniref:alpha-L-rhamnosidase n=1 Tax=Aeoliella mucimassa TaxID=2527972 RepID=A0A518AS02_9BACT|nr:alpha-L-rhamnosidase [Aeoliella mucimassa]QDU57486.1 Bacterial alpha-L-rhamnosidase [Aeoliella mucimassa]